MYRRPVCVKCSRDMLPKTNDVTLVDVYQKVETGLWLGDLWHCPECGVEVIIGFGTQVPPRDAGFRSLIAEAQRRGVCYYSDVEKG